MTDPSPRPRPVNAVVASARRIKLNERRPRPSRTQSRERAERAWHFYDVIGEAKQAINYLADHLAKLRLYPALVPDDPRDPPSPDTDPLGFQALASLRGTSGGYAEILREATINLQVSGECYLVGMSDEELEDPDASSDRIDPIPGTDSTARLAANSVQLWDIKSTDEIDVSPDGTTYIRNIPGGGKIPLTDANAFVVRIWRRHPRFSFLADSPMFGILSSLEEIERIELAIRAAAKSRAAGPGLLLLPEEMSFGSTDPTLPDGGEDAENDPFQAELIETMSTAVRDEGSAASLVPIVVRGPAELLREIRKVSLSIDIDEKLLTLERAITRLAQGLNVPPEIITGKADLNHWVAWQVSEEVFSAHVEPLAVPIVDALTVEWYRVFLEAAGMSAEEASRRMLWYDPTAIITRPNRSADADFGLEHIALSESAWRKAKDFPEEDAPTDLERLMRLVMQRGSFDPVFTSVLLQLLGLTPDSHPQLEAINQPPSPSPTPAPPASSNDPPAFQRPRSFSPPTPRAASLVIVASGGGPDGVEVGGRLYDIDRDIAVRLHSSADAALRRALDRASSIVISKFRHDKHYSGIISGIDKREVPGRIGVVALQANGLAVEDLLASSFDPLADQFRSWARRAYARAFRVLGLSSDESPDEPTINQAVEEAATWLVSALSLLASSRLFDPSPTAEMFGELDDSTEVPFSLIREALARAGGATPAGIYVSPSLEPMGGIATGALVLAAFTQVGGGIEGWQWVYGEAIRAREFPPHHDLDGARFSSWTDDALANRQTWPRVTHYVPGDHAGCLCGSMPIMLMPAEAVA